ncbi:hypothetical protein F2Q69_00063946 [Brassica cretica]|uniref:Uncharacterized protein n=1 Tax=Brassica cretica TaxID=69181 RepID=A0A8S9PJI6_BRACR|nr:hypothetical protein F2Q69_00063946 [Brassica cretica]
MTALTKHTVCLCLLVWMQIRIRPERMAKSNCNTRRTVNETAKGSASNVARNEAGTEEARNAAQNAANLNNAAAAGAAAAPVGLEAVLAMLAQVLARLRAAAAPSQAECSRSQCLFDLREDALRCLPCCFWSLSPLRKYGSQGP